MKYVFKPYSTKFATLFASEKKRNLEHLGTELAQCVLIEHIIPDMGGKGIIDIGICIQEKDLGCISRELEKLGYIFRESGSAPERKFFRIDLPDTDEVIRRYHVHVTFPKSSEWRSLIGFRDYLRAHPEEAARYAIIKQQAAREANEEGGRYRTIKDPFFKEILSKISYT